MAQIDATKIRNLDGTPKTVARSFGRYLTDSLLPKTVALAVGLPKDAFGSVDLTNRCNLRCRHCYFYEQELPQELSDEQWLAKFEEMANGARRIWSVTWVGGEPLLRKSLIEAAKKLFHHNLIVTNGLIPLPDWPDVYFHVSIDGDEEAHERQRNQKGIYRQIMKNVSRPELDVSIAYCVSSLNTHCIEKVLAEWRDTGVKGFLFSFYTPVESIRDPLFPGWEERDRIIDLLLDLKGTRYGPYILNEPRVLELMKSDRAKKVTDRCVFLSKGFALDTMGNRKGKCMMGEKADCDRCGCVVPFHLAWRSERRKVLREMLSDLTAFVGWRVRRAFDSGQAPLKGPRDLQSG